MFKDEIIKIEILKSMTKEEHFNSYIEIVYVIRGEVHLTVEATKYLMKKEDIAFINKNSKYTLITSPDTIFISFQINYLELCKLADKKSILFQEGLIIDNDTKDFIKLKEHLNSLLECTLNNGKKLMKLKLEISLISELIESFMIANIETIDEDKNRKHIVRVDAIKNYIHSNYKEKITLSDLADKKYLSVPYLSKFIKEHFGVTFTEYLNSVRLNYAMESILNTDLPITRIALENGFATTTIFNKCFKEFYKMTPNEYRRKLKQVDNHDKKIDNQVKNEVRTYLHKTKNNEIQNELSKEQTKIKIDINKTRNSKKHYNKIINIGYANDLLQSLLQEHILMLKNELRFEYARFWGIFNEDMNIESVDHKYTFYKIDKILDFMVNNKIKPFIDLTPKAKSILKNVREDIIIESNAVKLRNLDEWERLIHHFIVHCINRYGNEEVGKWYFEVSRYKIPNPDSEDKQYNKAYCQIFDVIYSRIKEVLPNAKVGGPGDHFGDSDPFEFFSEWRNYKAKPDFISMYIYPYSTLAKNGEIEIFHSSEQDFLLNKLYEIKEMIETVGFSSDEIIISEWNLTISSRNYINDSCFKAAYIVKNIIDSMDKVDGLSYWKASDLSEEYLDTDFLLQGGTGLVSKNGIKKPSFYAFSFLENLSENIVQKGKNYIMTKNSNNAFTLICHNYKHFNKSYLLNYEENFGLQELENIYENENTLTLSFSILNLQRGKYRVKGYTLNESYGSVLNKWIELNAENHLRGDEIAYLKGVTIPKLNIEYIEGCESELHYSLELQPHEVRLVTFEMDYN